MDSSRYKLWRLKILQLYFQLGYSPGAGGGVEFQVSRNVSLIFLLYIRFANRSLDFVPTTVKMNQKTCFSPLVKI